MRCVALLGAVASGADQGISPVSKVITMLGELQAKVTKQGERKQKQYDSYADFCRDQAQKVHHDIGDEKDSIEALEAGIMKATSDISAAVSRISRLSEQTAEDEKELKRSEALRKKEFATFRAQEDELMAGVHALDRATSILRRQLSTTGALQMTPGTFDEVMVALNTIVMSSAVSSADKHQLTGLIQASSADGGLALEVTAPGKSSEVVMDTLEDLKDKAEAQLAKARKADLQGRHAAELLAQSLQDSMRAQTTELSKRKKAKSLAEGSKADDEAELEQTQQDLKADQEGLQELQHDCMSSASDFENEMREIKAQLTTLQKAKDIIQEAKDAGNREYDDGEAALLQVATKAHSKTRLRSRSATTAQVLATADTLRKVGLVQAASRIQAAAAQGGDVFSKVKGMVREMIRKLEKKAADEATLKDYCDKEIAANTQETGEHKGTYDVLGTRVDKEKSTIAELRMRMGALIKEQGEIASAQKEIDAMAKQAKVDFDATIADYNKGVKAVQLALKVLKEYYASKEDDALIQKESSPPSSSGFLQSRSSAGEGGAGGSGGIIAFLEVIESDFSKAAAQLTADEEMRVEEHEAETLKNRIRMAELIKDQHGIEARIMDQRNREASDEQDQDGEASTLQALSEFRSVLDPKCTTTPEPYAERKRRRDAEMEGLKNAIEVLEGNALP